MTTQTHVAEFENHQRYLKAVAYRMLGSRAAAEDIVQDTWLRWDGADRSEVRDARAFLTQTVTRLCLDHIKSAKLQREVYTGTWLPEPLVDDDMQYQPGPEAMHELASDLSYAFLLTLEKLSPLERAAFLLHDVFDVSYADVALALDRNETACRQLAARARTNVRAGRPSVPVPREQQERLASAFASAIASGDVGKLADTLAADVRFLSDGGGRVSAVPYVLVGRDLIAKTLIGFVTKARGEPGSARPAVINGQSGFVFFDADGNVQQTVAIEADGDGRIGAIYVVRNPDKLRQVLH